MRQLNADGHYDIHAHLYCDDDGNIHPNQHRYGFRRPLHQLVGVHLYFYPLAQLNGNFHSKQYSYGHFHWHVRPAHAGLRKRDGNGIR